ncbi:MAG: bifunctional transaldolase/phosoglucose isomerase [Anaerolineales bacterium]
MGNIAKLVALGQSLWMDNIQRHLLENGEIQTMIDRGNIRGMTSNPTIFDRAISDSEDYHEALTSLAWAGWDAEKIFWELAVEDVREAADLFAPLYESSGGQDGYVSIEVSPLLANDTEGTVAQAQQLWARVGRPNIMVKIPGTQAGIPAIRQATAAGLNINVTLIFSRDRYAEVMDAFMSGLEDRLEKGRSVEHIASVASFFVSRVDVKVDKLLPENSPLRGRIAIANAKLAYDDFLKTCKGERWERLEAKGARLQRPLWASTSTKNPAYPDTLYVDNLVGPNTVNTVPPNTLDAVRDHGKAAVTITEGVDQAREAIASLERSGILMRDVTRELEHEGVKAFSASIEDLLKTIEKRRSVAVRGLGPVASSVAKRIATLESESAPGRLWAHDPTLWTDDPAGQKEVEMRMGWTDAPQKARQILGSVEEFAKRIRSAGPRRFLVLGMGGSSLTAEVLSSLFAAGDGSMVLPGTTPEDELACLGILDSSHPAQVSKTATDYPPDESFYIVASKSGGTAEVSAAFDFFWALAGGDNSRFAATTDAKSSLDAMARKLKFTEVFNADPTVGGRYSALTHFGMVPAALLGIDVGRFLDRAEWMQHQCDGSLPAARNPGLALGAVLGEAALAGRDKLTLLADPPIRALPNWIEQLVAESSGKHGKGIIPVPLEPLDSPSLYQGDRIFVYFRQTGSLDTGVQTLAEAGFPVLVFDVRNAYDAGSEFFRWEMAVAVACHILGVNAFDQPDVQESKDRTKSKIEEYRSTGRLDEGKWDIEIDDGAVPSAQKRRLLHFIQQAGPNQYFAINAYLPRTVESVDALQRMRVAIRERTRSAVAAGFGPRFQHSTGQLYKGGPNTGLFLQITSDVEDDLRIPTEGMTFGTFIRAQALGDYETLMARERRVLRVHLKRPGQLHLLVEALQ